MVVMYGYDLKPVIAACVPLYFSFLIGCVYRY